MSAARWISVGVAVGVLASASVAAAGTFDIGRTTLVIGGMPVVVSGSLAPTIDLVAHSDRWQIGAAVFRDVVARAREDARGIHACITARIEGAQAQACTTVPRSLDALAQLRAADLEWHLDGKTIHAHGTAALAWSGGQVTIARGHADVALAARTLHGGVQLAATTISAELAGSLAPLDVVATGTAKSAELVAKNATITDLELPFSLRATRPGDAVELVAADGLVLQAAHLELEVGGTPVEVVAPALALRDPDPKPFAPDAWRGMMRWHAGAVTWRGVRIPQPSGTVDPDGHHEIRFAGVDLGAVAAAMSDHRLVATGVLDGAIELRDGDSGIAVVRVAARARGAGTLEIGAPLWLARMAKAAEGLAVRERVMATLADFHYTRLDAVYDPQGRLKISLAGRGRRVAQALDVVINVNGLRDAARTLDRSPS